MYHHQFVVHTTYHSGTVYISLPWSYRSSSPPDWNHINQLGGVYSNTSNYPNLPYGQGNTGMYAINGSTKDSNYGIQGSISWSMEISDSKQPPASQIMTYYNYNYPAMIAMIEYSGYGLQGAVTDANTGEAVTAVVFVNDYMPTFTDPTAGDYHKYVLPGTYSITIVANGYETQTIDNITVTSNSATNTDFQLTPEDGQYVYKFSSSRIPGNNEADEGNTKAVIGAPDNINYSIGKNGWCVLDLQNPVIDGPGPDIIVYEGDTSPEGFTCYAGETIDGPWISLGTGNGTTEFDIAESGLPEAQFFKILDDGDGSANVADAGFDLDAIEALEPVSGVYLAMYEYTVNDSNGNNNGKIDPGETVDLIVTLKNNGDVTAENISGEISTTSPYFTIVTGTADFGTLAQSETGEGTFTVTANASTPAGQPAGIDLNVTSNGGTYTNSFAMNFVIGQIPVVIIDLDGNHNSGPAIQAAIEDNGLAAEYTTSFPSSLDIYSSIFVCLGIYSDNHVLSSSEGQALADFLNNGGSLYMEGGDTWAYDNQTAAHTMFNINGEEDGTSDMSTVAGQAGTFTEGMSFSYGGDNSYMDHIVPLSSAFLILENQSPVYGTAIANDGGTYKTIGASHEFGGLTDGTSPSTKAELMAEYLNFFGLTASLQASFSASSTEICEEGTVNFNDLSTGDVTSREWTFEGGTPETSTLENPTVMYYNTGSFDVTLTVSDGTNTSTLTLEDYITVNTTPDVPAMPEGETVVCSNNPEMLTQEYTTTGSAGATTYDWLLEPAEAGEITGSGTTATVNYTELWEGDATISVKAINDCGESDYSETLAVECYICDGVDENDFGYIEIYPNPNNGSFIIKIDESNHKNTSIKIYNSVGEVVYEKNDIATGLIDINLGEINPGLYYVIVNNDKSVVNKKIIIN
jgi:PKD repeat protein